MPSHGVQATQPTTGTALQTHTMEGCVRGQFAILRTCYHHTRIVRLYKPQTHRHSYVGETRSASIFTSGARFFFIVMSNLDPHVPHQTHFHTARKFSRRTIIQQCGPKLQNTTPPRPRKSFILAYKSSLPCPLEAEGGNYCNSFLQSGQPRQNHIRETCSYRSLASRTARSMRTKNTQIPTHTHTRRVQDNYSYMISILLLWLIDISRRR